MLSDILIVLEESGGVGPFEQSTMCSLTASQKTSRTDETMRDR